MTPAPWQGDVCVVLNEALQLLATGEAVAHLDVTQLQRSLLAADVAIAFFNQHRQTAGRPDYGERRLAACHGEWDSFDLH